MLEGSIPRRFRIVVAAASAGGLPALARMLEGLPADFSLPIAVVQHLHPDHASRVAEILGRKTPLHVKEAQDGELLAARTVYVAPPGEHLLVEPGGGVRLTQTAPIHYLRPSADELFASAARTFGPAIAVILTGTGTDGASGAASIKAGGGVVIAQDEATSEFFGMPHAAIDAGVVDFVLPLEKIAGHVTKLAASAV